MPEWLSRIRVQELTERKSKGLTHVLMCESKDPKLIVSTFGCQNDNVVICCHVSDPFES